MSITTESINSVQHDTLNHVASNLGDTITSTHKIIETTNINNIAILIAIIAIVICFAIIIFLFIETINFKEKVVKLVLKSERINKKFINEYPKNNSQFSNFTSNQMSEAEIKQYIIKSIELNKDRDINAIVDRVLECLHKDNNSPQQKNVEIQDPTVKKPIANLLYATPADDNAVFENTSNEITEDSFFILTINQNQKTADFALIDNDKVTTKIIKVNDYLITSCEKIGSGTTRITTTNKGKAELQSNGKWKVITKAKVKFE